MNKALWCFLFFWLHAAINDAQTLVLSGNVYSKKMEPLPLVSVRVKSLSMGTVTNEYGHFELSIPEGKYELVYSAIGYKPYVATVVLQANTKEQQVILEDDEQQLQEVSIVSNSKDRSKEIIKKVIAQKDSLMRAAGSYSFDAYIKAFEKREIPKFSNLNKGKDSIKIDSSAFAQFAEVHLKINKAYPDKIKEIRDGMNIKGFKRDFYYLSFTEGEFNFYDNLIRVPTLSDATFLSPVSRSGLLTYKYKNLGLELVDDQWMYHITFKPSKASNALQSGDVWILDNSWIIYKMKASFPEHLTPKFNFFEATVTYQFVEHKLWLPSSYYFSYQKAETKAKGNTAVTFSNYNIDTIFNKKTFNDELSATADSAYTRDSTFWTHTRPTELSNEEMKVIRYKDSITAFLHSEKYQDSIEHKTNKITLMKVGYSGLTYANWREEKSWYFQPLLSLIDPVSIGGVRLSYNFSYTKKFSSKRFLYISPNISYGFLNKDFRGSVLARFLYDPIKRSYLTVNVGRNVGNVFSEESPINLLIRNGYYLKDNLTLTHQTELLNGLNLYNTLEFGIRHSMANYKFYNIVDSIYKNEVANKPIDFQTYNAFFYELQLSYTPHQMYLREPKEKIILGSNYPTIYAKWRIGIPHVFGSTVNYNRIEIGLTQEVFLGTLGTTTYNLRYGNFLSAKNVESVDYRRIERGTPYLFLNATDAFQSMDSSFALYKGFGEFHLKHDFNGAIINKIPYAKKLRLFESIGASALYAPERKLIYGEMWFGVEKQFRLFQQIFRVGGYGVSSWSNAFQNPLQFKIGIKTFSPFDNKWR